jgi:2-methylcitrate dehydratase PrpD
MMSVHVFGLHGVGMSQDLDHGRRQLLGMGGAALLSSALPFSVARGRDETGPTGAQAQTKDSTSRWAPSSITSTLAAYVAETLDRELPANVIVRVKLHVLDTLAAAVSGSRLKPGELAARYTDSLGGKPQATVIGTNIVTSPVLAAFANGMMAHSDETDDTNPVGPFHPGCSIVPAALATAELTGRTGNDVLRAVTLGYDVGVRLLQALGGTRHNPSCMTNTFAATATAAAMLRLDPRQVRHAFSYAGQLASGIGYWDRDIEHIEKAFDFSRGAHNGVMAATMVAMGATATDDPFSGNPNVLTVLGEKPAAELLIAELGSRFEVLNTTIKKWTVGLPLQSVLDNVAALLQDRAVRAGKIKHIRIEVATGDIHIVDNNPNPDLCVQHLIALAIADRGVTFASVHDRARMNDPKVLAIRRLVEVIPSAEMQQATPAHQTTLGIVTADGRSLSQHTAIVRGLARNPMDASEVESKALDLMGPILGSARANELIAAAGNLDRFGPVSGLRRLLQA